METINIIKLAGAIGAYKRCKEDGKKEWEVKWKDIIDTEAKKLPSGSGFDNGTYIDIKRSGDEKVVFCTPFHHMDEQGGYDGWTSHDVIVTPSFFGGFKVTVTGRNRRDIKTYIHTVFHALFHV